MQFSYSPTNKATLSELDSTFTQRQTMIVQHQTMIAQQKIMIAQQHTMIAQQQTTNYLLEVVTIVIVCLFIMLSMSIMLLCTMT